MKLAFDCRYVRIDRHDGISRYSAELAHAVVKQHPQTVLLINDERQLKHLPQTKWVKIGSPTGVFEPFRALQINLKVKPDIVFTPMQTMGSIGRKFTMIATIHDFIYYLDPTPPPAFNPLIRLLWRFYHSVYWPQRLLLKGVDAVTCVSHTTANLAKQLHMTKKPIRVITNAPDQAFFTAERTAPPDTKNIVYMGSFMPYKGVETLAQAMQELPDWTLHLCSKINDEAKNRILPLAPEGSIVVHNGISDKKYARLLQDATAMVTASTAEGFCIPIVEAMASGTPVVCTDMPIFHEVGGNAAHFAKAGNSTDFATKIKQFENKEIWLTASSLGRNQAASFSWTASATELIDFCKQIHKQRTGK